MVIISDFRVGDEMPSSRSSSVGPTHTTSGGSGGRIPGLERSTSGDSDNEISKNRDFYRSHDVRPPFTYAALIRQVDFFVIYFQHAMNFKFK